MFKSSFQNSKLVKNFRGKAFRLVGIQTAVVMFLALILGFANRANFLGVVLGGLTMIIPNLYFAYRWFGTMHASNKTILKSFYWNELIKMAMSISMMLMFLSVVKVKVISLFIGFFGAYLGLWLEPVVAVFETNGSSRCIND